MRFLPAIIFLSATIASTAQEIIPLYDGIIPNSTGYKMKEVTIEKGKSIRYSKISEPTLTLFFPPAETATGMAVIICPGGGYLMETYENEGTKIAASFIQQGIAAFVLKYRLPSDSIMTDKSTGPLQDAQRAIKTVREHAPEWNISPGKIGIMGFSAGGHLASTAATHYSKAYIDNAEGTSLRPDFLILVYPVISMADGLTHAGSKSNLLGENPSDEQVVLFSNDKQVSPTTPPTWIIHTGDDTVVPVENSILFYQALIRNNIPAEMHLYPRGNHGFVNRITPGEWMGPLFEWLRSRL